MASAHSVKPVWDANAFAVVEIIGGAILAEAAAFEHTDSKTAFLQLQSQGNAGDASPDDTDVGLDDRFFSELPSVDEHFWQSLMRNRLVFKLTSFDRALSY
jgi:hypothetical protein